MPIFRGLQSFYTEMATNERRRLLHFSLSTVVFFVCYGLIYSIAKLPPSTRQEAAAAILVSMGAIAFSYAIVLQLVYIISRISGPRR